MNYHMRRSRWTWRDYWSMESSRLTSRRGRPCADLWGRGYLPNITWPLQEGLRQPNSGNSQTSTRWMVTHNRWPELTSHDVPEVWHLPIWSIYLQEPLDNVLSEWMYTPTCCLLFTEVRRVNTKSDTVRLTFEPFWLSKIFLKIGFCQL